MREQCGSSSEEAGGGVGEERKGRDNRDKDNIASPHIAAVTNILSLSLTQPNPAIGSRVT